MNASKSHPVLLAYAAAFEGYIPERLDSPRARQLLVAISKQEADWIHRWQIVDANRPHIKGPARGLLQFEQGGGVKGVMTHRASRALAREAVAAAGVAWNMREVWLALERDDALAMALGRLLLLTDPRTLPEIGKVQAAWDYYEWNWRPGKPHPEDWPNNYRDARRLIEGKS
jgi:hypothetical protein